MNWIFRNNIETLLSCAPLAKTDVCTRAVKREHGVVSSQVYLVSFGTDALTQGYYGLGSACLLSPWRYP